MARMSSLTVSEPPPLRIDKFRGINTSVTPTQIDFNQSPDMLNYNIDERGALNKRTGYTRVFANSLGVGKINGMFEYRKKDGSTIFLFAHGTNLYTQSGESQPLSIYSSLANQSVSFFVMNDKCYIMDGVNYLVYDGASCIAVVPYIPTLTISGKPGTLSTGALSEDFNLIGAGFKETFSGDNTGKVFAMSLKNLDTTPVIVKVNGVLQTLTTHYTVDFVAGTITFITAPSTGTNNVEITAYKTIAGNSAKIFACKFNCLFGGSNDTRVFISGNSNLPNYVYRSGLYDPTYFPENGFYKIGSESDPVTAFSKQYDYLVIHKSRSIGKIQFQLVNGVSSFPYSPVNDTIGAYAANSVQLIENNPVFLDVTGVYMLVQSNLRDERNVQHLSKNVDSTLLHELNLKNAISVDFDRKYMLSINGKVYVYDYSIEEWYLYDNILADCFLEMNGYLYFGANGMIYRFKRSEELFAYNDDGQTINDYWRSKYYTFDADELRKLVEKVFISMKPGHRTSLEILYVSNKKESGVIKTSRMDTLDFRDLDFNFLSFIVSNFPQEVMAKVKAKKVTHFQLVIRNGKIDESLGVLSIVIKYQYQSEVR